MSWLYYIVGALVVVVGLVAFVLYRGYNKVKPKPIAGIPYPPFTHAVLGHPDKVLHPAKHELRLQVTESTKAPLHQLVLMSHSSVFINDAKCAGDAIKDLHRKGAMYNSFRLDANTPDVLACDDEAFSLRKTAFGNAFSVLKLSKDTNQTFHAMLHKLSSCAETNEPLDLLELSSLLALDALCSNAFGYDLHAFGFDPSSSSSSSAAPTQEALHVYRAYRMLLESQAASGIYQSTTSSSKAPTTPEELLAARATWRTFLAKLLDHMKVEAESYVKSHGDLNAANRLDHAIIHLINTNVSNEDASIRYDELNALSDIHQILKHGHEAIASSICWMFYALYRNPQVRAKLETEMLNQTSTPNSTSDKNILSSSNSKEHSPGSEYLECVIKETLRRYPACGNMTLRTVDSTGYKIADKALPLGTPVHMHMWTLHNTEREWDTPKQFMPERWMHADDNDMKGISVNERPKFSRCPFSFMACKDEAKDRGDVDYQGCGNVAGSLSFFPFSVGPRSCPGREFSLEILRRVLLEVCLKFHVDPYDNSFGEDDFGNSMHSVIVPLYPQSVSVRVSRLLAPGKANISIKAAVQAKSDGWADEEEEEDE